VLPVVQDPEFSWPGNFVRSDLFLSATASDPPTITQYHQNQQQQQRQQNASFVKTNLSPWLNN